MIYDADTWIGHWPFRPLPRKSANDLLRQMDRHGIEKSLVGHLHGLFYKDSHEANRELIRAVEDHRDRLVPCGLLNPNYHGWREDLKQCREEFGMPVLRLAPGYHEYSYQDGLCDEMVGAAFELEMCVAPIGRLVDARGRHPIDPGRETGSEGLIGLLEKFPRDRFLLLNFASFPAELQKEERPHYADIVRFVGGAGGVMPTALDNHGVGRFVFGTTMLMRYAKSVFLALDLCELEEEERDRILWKNLAELLPEMD
ncbi:MAG: amidohydrolase family protein [Candidatus Brocadiia bacterium]